MKIKKTQLVLVITLLFSITGGNSQNLSRINGVVFLDYYNNLSHHDAAQKNISAFQYRRIYFTFENNITKDIKFRFRLESAHGEFGSTNKIVPFVKNAYLEWSRLIPHHKLYLGISEANAFNNTKNYWGYRSIEKTIMNLNKICPSADMGIALKGDLGSLAHHWLTVTNGPGYGSSEVDRYKKIGYAFWLTPIHGLIIESYMDYEKQDPAKPNFKYSTDYFGSSGYYTMKGFIGYMGSHCAVGAEVFSRTNQESGMKDTANSNLRGDVKRFGYSLFGSWTTPSPKLKVFARYDFFDPNTNDHIITSVSGTRGMDDEESLLIAGLDVLPIDNIHIMPNILFKNYTEEKKDSDLTVRITLYYQFDSGEIKAK